MTARVFISWSGIQGREVADALHATITTELQEWGADVELVFSRALPPGVDWRRRLFEEQLPSVDLVLVVIDPASLRSPWVGFEAGIVFALRGLADGPKMLPIVLSEDANAAVGSPYDMFQHAYLTVSGVRSILEQVVAGTGTSPTSRQLEVAATTVHAAAIAAMEGARREERAGYAALLEGLGDLVTLYERFGLLEDEDARGFHLLLDTPLSRDVLCEVGQIVDAARTCMTSTKDHEFGTLAFDWALENLIRDTRERLTEIVGGRVSMRNRASVRSFWVSSVFGRARTSIWTTNFASLGNTMGNDTGRLLLRAQAENIRDRGISVTRLFVYDPEMPAAEAMGRRELMRAQLAIGVEVMAISEADFNTAAVNAGGTGKIGSNDFMLIDDQLLYITIPGEEDLEAVLISGDRHPGRLRAAKDLKALLLEKADVLDEESIARFPALHGTGPG